MAKRQAKKHPLYDNPRSQPAEEEFEDEGEGDEGLAAKARNDMRKKHLAEWHSAKDLSPDKIKDIQRRHSQEKEDLEFDEKYGAHGDAEPGSEADVKQKARDADRAGARE